MDIYRWLTNQWDRTAAAVAVVVGLIALVLGYIGVSNNSLPGGQLPYIASGAMFGLFCVGIGATLWLSADMRDEWRKLEEVRARLDDIYEAVATTPPEEARAEPAPVQNRTEGRRRQARV
jgi:hypothetical protein